MNGGNSEIVSVGDKITAGGQIQTQAQAVAEITFPDGSKIRIGNNSTFSFDPNDRTVRLDRGSALVCTPPAAEGINIVSGGVSGAVAGDPAGKTFLVTAYPADGSGGKTAGATGGVVLQGNAATTVAAPSGSVTIAPGQLAVIGASGGAPSLHTVDLAQVIRSTPLIGGFPTPLPTTGAILNTAIGQQTQISRGVLTPTGTSGVAITFGGQLLTAGSPPPNSAPPSFPMAVSTPGFNGNLTGTASVSQLANINTAGGGGGSGPFGGLTPSGVTGGGGGGPGGPTVPGSINTPN
ncbi:MAG: hypothetical protein EBZ83_03355, partial [Verrucomicrobia bacterium]|nr:hypothetical protein [Verrucomicrobiota bacterium]